jgi:hypothetical protein
MADWTSPEEFARVREPIKLVADNRLPPGYTVYPTGIADALQASGYRAGTALKFDANNKVRRFQMLNHWYGIGGRAIWEGADLDDYLNGFLKAPATSHGVNTAGDFNKYAVGGGINMFTPAAPGAGAWSLSLTEKHTGTQVLKCVPVPSSTGTGFFDYDSQTNVIAVNATQTGGYNLFDTELTLHCFGAGCWGAKSNGGSAETKLEIPGVVGKLLFNSWVIEFTLVTTKTADIKVGFIMITGVKGNV